MRILASDLTKTIVYDKVQQLLIICTKIGRAVKRMKMNEFSYMSAALELFAATVTAVMLVGCFLERKHRTKTGKFLVGVLIAHTSMLLVDAPIWLLLAKPAPENVVWVKILSFFVDTFLCALISLYTYCLTAYISEKKRYHTDMPISLPSCAESRCCFG